MKSMLQHSFVLDALETTGADTFSHFEVLIEEHRLIIALKNVEGGGQQQQLQSQQPSRLQQLVPTIGTFHTPLPLRRAFKVYNDKHRLTKRKHIQISFNEIRHILNLAQIMALREDDDNQNEENVMQSESEQKLEGILEDGGIDPSSSSSPTATAAPSQLNGPRLISFDGDQTLYSDGSNFEGNPELANYMYLLLRHGVFVAVVTAAGYEYQSEKYEFRLSGLLKYFSKRGLTPAECERFYLFGGECNYLLRLGPDYRLHPVREQGPGGWCTATQYLPDAPANWSEDQVTALLDVAQLNAQKAVEELNLRRARVIRKRRSIGLVPISSSAEIPRESLDETVLRVHEQVARMNDGKGPCVPYCAFNGGTDCWVDVGNKRVGVQILQSYLGVAQDETLHIGDQFVS
jgi:IMP and pyridine-specific 5'-nucleotidase